MKRLTSLICVLVLLVGLACIPVAAAGEVTLDFQGFSEYDEDRADGIYWKTANNSVAPEVVGGELVFAGTADQTAQSVLTFPATGSTAQKAVVEVVYRVEGDSSSASIGAVYLNLSSNDGSVTDQIRADVKSGCLRVGGTSLTSVVPAEKIHIKYILDFENDTYDTYIDGFCVLTDKPYHYTERDVDEVTSITVSSSAGEGNAIFFQSLTVRNADVEELVESEYAVREDFNAAINFNNAPWSKSGGGIAVADGVMPLDAGTASKDNNVTRSFDTLSGKVVVEWDFNLKSGYGTNFYSYNSSNVNFGRISSTREKDTGKFHLYAYCPSKVDLISDMENNRYYRITMVYDFTAGTVSYFVDGKLVLANTGFYSQANATDLGSFMMGAGSCTVDDNTVYSQMDVQELRIGTLTDNQAIRLDKWSIDLGDLSSVTDDLELPQTGAYGSAISWVSDQPGIIDSNGHVNRADVSGTADVKLTATVFKSGVTSTRVFTATVSNKDERKTVFTEHFANLDAWNVKKDDDQAVIKAATADGRSVLEMTKPEGTGRGDVNLTRTLSAASAYDKIIVEMEFKSLMTSGSLMFLQDDNGASLARVVQKGDRIVLQHSDDAVNNTESNLVTGLTVDGWHNIKIAVDTANDLVSGYYDDTLIIESVPVRSGSGAAFKSVIISFNPDAADHYGTLYVDKLDVYAPSNQELAELVAGGINVPQTVSGNMALPAKGTWGADIAWTSDNTEVVANDGSVVRPAYGEAAVNVGLHAAVTYGVGSATRDITVSVQPHDAVEASGVSFADQTGAPLEQWQGAESITATATITVNSDESLTDGMLILAVYDADGVLQKAFADTKPTLTKEANGFEVTCAASELASGGYIRAYLWQAMKPMTVAVTLPETNS